MIKEFVEMPRLEEFVGKTFRFFSPNTWTTISLLVAVLAFAIIIGGSLFWGILLFIVSTLCDLIDGKVARYNNQASALGAFWDGTVDRFVDALIIAPFFFLDLPAGDTFVPLFLFALLFNTLLPPFIVAYANHRGAVPDPTEKVIWRFALRIEYLLFFFGALIFYPYSAHISLYFLWGGQILMVATVVQSIYLVFVKAKLYL